MRFKMEDNGDHTYTIRDNLFGTSETHQDYEYARQRNEELNKQHLAEITFLERQFL